MARLGQVRSFCGQPDDQVRSGPPSNRLRSGQVPGLDLSPPPEKNSNLGKDRGVYEARMNSFKANSLIIYRARYNLVSLILNYDLIFTSLLCHICQYIHISYTQKLHEPKLHGLKKARDKRNIESGNTSITRWPKNPPARNRQPAAKARDPPMH